MQSVSFAIEQQALVALDDVIIPLVITALVGWLVQEVVKLFPRLAAVLTATRIAQGEAAISKQVTADIAAAVPGTLTVSDATAKRINGVSAALQIAMDTNGTSKEQLAARVVGTVLTAAPPVAADGGTK